MRIISADVQRTEHVWGSNPDEHTAADVTSNQDATKPGRDSDAWPDPQPLPGCWPGVPP